MIDIRDDHRRASWSETGIGVSTAGESPSWRRAIKSSRGPVWLGCMYYNKGRYVSVGIPRKFRVLEDDCGEAVRAAARRGARAPSVSFPWFKRRKRPKHSTAWLDE